MPPFVPVSRADLVKTMRRLGFAGPFQGTRHDFMRREDVTVRLPNPHRSEISRELLSRILSQAQITRDEWESH